MPDKRRFAVTGDGVLYIKLSIIQSKLRKESKIKQLTEEVVVAVWVGSFDEGGEGVMRKWTIVVGEDHQTRLSQGVPHASKASPPLKSEGKLTPFNTG
jgi:hypothetical protein